MAEPSPGITDSKGKGMPMSLIDSAEGHAVPQIHFPQQQQFLGPTNSVLAKESALERKLIPHNAVSLPINLESPGRPWATNAERHSMLVLKLTYRSRRRAKFLAEKIKGDAFCVESQLYPRNSRSPAPSQESIDCERHVGISYGETTCPQDDEERTDVSIGQLHSILELHWIFSRLITAQNAASIGPAVASDGTIRFRQEIIEHFDSSFSPDVERDYVEERRTIDEMWKNSRRFVMTRFHFVFSNVFGRDAVVTTECGW